MKHCSNCEYCELDLVAQYVKGIDLHKCILTGDAIAEPFWDGRKCERYIKRKKKDGSKLNFIQLW